MEGQHCHTQILCFLKVSQEGLKMKLSEAIFLGSMLTPQAIGAFEDARGGRCALAAACEATGRPALALYTCDSWRWIKRLNDCPECGGKAPTAELISHLNDKHGWSRVQIAKWVAAIEPTGENLPGE